MSNKGKKTFLKLLFICIIIASSCNFNIYAENTFNRISGEDRYITAIEVSKNGWKEGSSSVVLTTGDDFSDALCAGPLAKILNAPILLSEKSFLDKGVMDEMVRLGVKKVYIVGGINVISQSIENQLKTANIQPERIAGEDRYQTSILISDYMVKLNPDKVNKEIVITTGDDFPDALSIASIAAQKCMPIFLSGKDIVPDSVISYIKNHGITKEYIIGGSSILSGNMEKMLPNSLRLAGNDRYETNVAVLNYFIKQINFTTTYIATGTDFPDALSGSAFAAKSLSPIILTDKVPSKVTQDFFADNRISIKQISVLGGEKVVMNSTVEPLLPKIVSICNITSTVNEEQNYIPPTVVTAMLDNNMAKAVAINWGPAVIDTSCGLVKTFQGSVKGYSNNVSLVLNVMHPIMGKSKITADQMVKFLTKVEPNPKISCTAIELAKMFIEEGEIEGVRGDIAFCQSIHETGYFRFGGQVLPEQNNFSGIGATNNSAVGKGAWFNTPREGVRAQIQHLKAYSSTSKLTSECVDPRFSLIKRGRVPFWEWLGNYENPENANRDIDDRQGWACPGETYGHSIITLYEELKTIN